MLNSLPIVDLPITAEVPKLIDKNGSSRIHTGSSCLSKGLDDFSEIICSARKLVELVFNCSMELQQKETFRAKFRKSFSYRAGPHVT